MKRTKIVATLGPACGTVPLITKLAAAGVNVARLNFSHGTFRNHRQLIKCVRKVEAKRGVPLAILQDLPGPKIRIGELPKSGIILKDNTTVVCDTAVKTYKKNIIPVAYSELHTLVQPGERLLFDDGRVQTVVTSVDGTKITVRVTHGGPLISHKGINIPDSHLTVSALTEQDRAAVEFGVREGVDMMALSFVTKAADIAELRALIAAYENEYNIKTTGPIRIIAKIERTEAVKNMAEIIAAADGIMVARGDLGIEIPAAEVPLVQKKLIRLTVAAGKPVIVATQMLDSMQHNPNPTRAEVSDVANAVIDHADALMLSNETAMGEFPLETVRMMAGIITTVEASEYDDLPTPTNIDLAPDAALAVAARQATEVAVAKAIVVPSTTGDLARLVSRFRPEVMIVAPTTEERTYHQLALSWGVFPLFFKNNSDTKTIAMRSVAQLKEQDELTAGDKIVLLGHRTGNKPGQATTLEIQTIA